MLSKKTKFELLKFENSKFQIHLVWRFYQNESWRSR